MPKCLYCDIEMEKLPGGIPSWMHPDRALELITKSRPGLWRMVKGFYTGSAVKRGLNTIDKNVATYRCSKCGWIAIFEGKADQVPSLVKRNESHVS